ncbi:MAG TPA: hypothetical protein VGH16_01300 [Candidatus Binatia bacterium]|jgi:hypothetical protein
MAEERSLQEGSPGYERRDLSPRAIALFGLALGIAIVLSAGIVTLFQLYAGSRFAKRQAPRPPLAVTREATEPRLQVDAPNELRTMREAEERTLNSYGWVDPQTETVRIPIERAMEILARKGLPAREEAKGKSQK